MIEDIPDHRRVFNKTDDPHRPLTFRADKGIDLVYLLKAKLHVHNQSGLSFYGKPFCFPQVSMIQGMVSSRPSFLRLPRETLL